MHNHVAEIISRMRLVCTPVYGTLCHPIRFLLILVARFAIKTRLRLYASKVMVEARLHECARSRVKRLAGRAQHFVDNEGHGRTVPTCEFRILSFALQSFFAALGALARRAGCAAAGAFALQQSAPRRRGGPRRASGFSLHLLEGGFAHRRSAISPSRRSWPRVSRGL